MQSYFTFLTKLAPSTTRGHAPVKISVATETESERMHRKPSPQRGPSPSLTRGVTAMQAAFRGRAVRKKQIIPKLKQIEAIRRKVDAIDLRYREKLARSKLTEEERRKLLRYYEEELLREMMKLDSITAGGSECIRERRKNAITHTQRLLQHVDELKAADPMDTSEATSTPTTTPITIDVKLGEDSDSKKEDDGENWNVVTRPRRKRRKTRDQARR